MSLCSIQEKRFYCWIIASNISFVVSCFEESNQMDYCRLIYYVMLLTPLWKFFDARLLQDKGMSLFYVVYFKQETTVYLHKDWSLFMFLLQKITTKFSKVVIIFFVFICLYLTTDKQEQLAYLSNC